MQVVRVAECAGWCNSLGVLIVQRLGIGGFRYCADLGCLQDGFIKF